MNDIIYKVFALSTTFIKNYVLILYTNKTEVKNMTTEKCERCKKQTDNQPFENWYVFVCPDCVDTIIDKNAWLKDYIKYKVLPYSGSYQH